MRRNKPHKALTCCAANGKVFTAGLKVPSTFRAASSHTKEGMMPEISPLSQIQLLICSPVNRYLRESDPCLDLSSSSSHLTCTLQASNSASHKASAVATPAKAVPHSAPHLPSPAPYPLRLSPKLLLPPNSSYQIPAPFPQPLSLAGLCCCLPGACKCPWPSPLLCWKTSLCKLFLIYVEPFSFDYVLTGWPPIAA